MGDTPIFIPTVVPLFPLDDVVLFPRAMLPLHIFEPRYRQMAADALAGGQMIGLALLAEGYAPLYYTSRAPIYPVVGIGQIVASEKLDDGNYNILLRGLARAEVVKELKDKPYREARVKILRSHSPADAEQTAKLRDELKELLQNPFFARLDLRRQLSKLFNLSLELGELADLLASGLPVPAAVRLALLAETDSAARASHLLDQIRTLIAISQNRTGGDSKARLN
jgi:uncharacterized protein